MKTQPQIRKRFDSWTKDTDPFGWRREVLLECMTLDTARDLLRDDADTSDWAEPDPGTAARKYLAFAVEKAARHRGLSAGRSIEKLEEFLWVLDEDTLASKFDAADYKNYGAPQLKILLDAWKVTDEEVSDSGFLRMARGLPCEPDCMEGCDR